MILYRAVFTFSIAVFLDIFCFSAISFFAVFLMVFRRQTDRHVVRRNVMEHYENRPMSYTEILDTS